MEKTLRLKEACAKAGINQKDLAPVLGISHTSLSTAITKGTLTVNQLEKLAGALDIPVSDLFERQEEFLAVIKDGDELRSFRTKDELLDYLFPGLPVLTMDQMQEVFKEYGKNESSEERGQ